MTTQNAFAWPKRGRCGTCGRGAIGFPSGRWAHVGRPCRARSQTMWTVNDLHIRAACRFIADGEPLPAESNQYRMDVTDRRGEFAVTRADRLAEEGRRGD